MDKLTIKSIILELRNDGKSFQYISDVLAQNYGVYKTRQAICSIYNRMTSVEKLSKNANFMIVSSDVLNLKALGLNREEIVSVLSNYYEITQYQIDAIIRDNKENYLKIQERHIKAIADILRRNGSNDEILDELTYKGITANQKEIKEYIALASSEILQSRAIDLIVKVINITGDTSILSTVNKRHKFNIALKQISMAMNKLDK